MADAVLWWTGVVTWIVLAVIGAIALFDLSFDWLIRSMWARKELVAFVADRLRRNDKNPTIPAN